MSSETFQSSNEPSIKPHTRRQVSWIPKVLDEDRSGGARRTWQVPPNDERNLLCSELEQGNVERVRLATRQRDEDGCVHPSSHSAAQVSFGSPDVEGHSRPKREDVRDLERARAKDPCALVLGHVERRHPDLVGLLLLARADLVLRERAGQRMSAQVVRDGRRAGHCCIPQWRARGFGPA
jgi:hypothetical protein